MSDDTYNGWTNRETWALHLWLTNEEPWYNMLRSLARKHLPEDKDEINSYECDKIKDAIEEWYDELIEGGGESARAAASDIGSLWRVDWQEFTEAVWSTYYE